MQGAREEGTKQEHEEEQQQMRTDRGDLAELEHVCHCQQLATRFRGPVPAPGVVADIVAGMGWLAAKHNIWRAMRYARDLTPRAGPSSHKV